MQLIGRILLFSFLLVFRLSPAQSEAISVPQTDKTIDSLYLRAFDNVQQTEYQRTLSNLLRAKELSLDIGNKVKRARATSALASVYLMLNQLEEASAQSVEAIELQRELGNKEELGKSYLTYATINLNAGDYRTADRYLTEAETTFLITQDNDRLAQVYLAQGMLYMRNEDFNAAEEKFQEAQNYFDDNDNNSYLHAKTLLEKAKAQEELNQYNKSETTALRSLEISRNKDHNKLELEVLKFLGNLFKRQEKYQQAYSFLEQSSEIQSGTEPVQINGHSLITDHPVIAALDPNGFQAQRRIQASKITTVLVIALVTILCLLALSLYKNNSLRAKANELLQNKNAELLIAKENAEKASMVKAQFLSTITHELRTPMYAVTGLTHLLLEEDPTEKQKKHLDSLKFSGEYLLSLINNILDLNKLEANKVEVEYTAFNLKKRVDDVIYALSGSAREKGNSIILEYENTIPEKLMGDPLMISQILINLIGNGNKFTRDGEIFVRIKKLEQTEQEIMLRFEVEDTGEGISKKKQKNIFQNFTQGSVQINRKFGGTGLGLSIVRRLLDLQNTQIDLESTLGKGSKFFFNLKYNTIKQEELQAEQEQPQEINYKILEGKKVLVVEDNKINQMITRKILEKNNMKCEVADNGEDAIEKIKNGNYDVVLMDIHMPGISGTDATTKIREFDHKVPILALTAVTIDENMDEFFIAGFTDIIPKPYKIEEFFSKIYKCLKDQEASV